MFKNTKVRFEYWKDEGIIELNEKIPKRQTIAK